MIILPCPHCRRRFRVPEDRVGVGSAKVRCPACHGLFVLDTTPADRVSGRTEPVESSGGQERSRDAIPGSPADSPTGRQSSPSARTLPHRGDSTLRNRWALLPAFSLLLALAGVLGPSALRGPSSPPRDPGLVVEAAKGGAEAPPSAARKDAAPAIPGVEAAAPAADTSRSRIPEPKSGYRFLRPFSPVGTKESCERLARLAESPPSPRGGGGFTGYEPWIAYLSLGEARAPGCGLEVLFQRATEGIRRKVLCGRGYAFLSAYYAARRMPDRARAFLEESLHLAPRDPWVKLSEALFYRKSHRDDDRAVRILEGVVDARPSFHLARYLLAKAYIERESYGKARDLFTVLEREFPRQRGFERVRRALAVLGEAPSYSAREAQGLLAVTRAFMALPDFPFAKTLCGKVLQEMASRLSPADRKLAYYDFGRMCEMSGEREAAYLAYRRALRIDPEFHNARERIGAVLRMQEGAKPS